ncbi:hypothetical protein A4A49_10719 [Nicotiana attenuata]|uniref:Uncharacterized protein n=1 Tax=Nicotiana attenuata TaxID=49451 RepID=A0A1J6IU18_NICAT|nr:hypothetical protein A4A49_10719 [Nicotiana attenuata]
MCVRRQQDVLINGNIKKKSTDQTTNWLSLNLEQVNQERSIFAEDEGIEVRDPSLSGRRRDQVFILNKDLEPPDQGEQREKPREEFKEAFQDIASMETEMDIAYRKETRLVSSDDELTRGYINSKYHDSYKKKGKLVQQSITLFNNLSPRNYQNPGGVFIQTQESAEENKEVQMDPTPNEPMVDSRKMDRFRRRLGIHQGFYNCSNKIWIFWTNEVDVTIIQDKEKHVLIKASYNSNPPIHMTVVYAKCTEEQRRELWQDMKEMDNNIQGPWGSIADFNVITSSEEKKCGRSYRMEESLDFIECLNECGLHDASFTGSMFTWCDNRDPPTTIWKRLDRLVNNTSWFDSISNTSVTHLSRACSDHAPLLVKMSLETNSFIKYFKFLNFWTALRIT